jgi:hypothetical protein
MVGWVFLQTKATENAQTKFSRWRRDKGRFYSADGFTAFRLGFRINHDDLPALLLRGLMPAGGDIDRYHYEPLAQSKPSLRARRITKGWGLNGRAAYMDTVLAEAAHNIEDGLTEQEVPVFHWMMSTGDRRNQSELARDLDLTKGALSKIIKRLSGQFRDWCNQRGKI